MDLEESGRQDEQFEGKSEIINGIEVQTHSMMSPSGNFLSNNNNSAKNQIRR